MWAAKELILNDFEDFLLKENLERRVLFSKCDKPNWVDTLYNIRIPLKGEVLPQTKYNQIKERVDVRKDRLVAKLLSDDTVLFVRYEECQCYPDRGERALGGYEDKYAVPEVDHIRALSVGLKAKYPSLIFKFLYISDTSGFMVDEQHNIVGIPTPDCDYRDHRITRKMREHLTRADIKSHLDEHL